MSAKKEDVKPVTEFAVATTVPGFITHAEIISALRAKYDGVTYDVSTPTGMAKAIAARKELREARVALDKRKPEVKREALDFCAKVEADYKAIRAAVSEYEDIPDAAIKEEEDRKEKVRQEAAEKEAARKKAITDRIAAMAAYPGSARILAMNSEALELEIATIEARVLGAECAEFLADAQAGKDAAVVVLKERLDILKAQEEEAARAEAARIEREAAEAVERERIKKEQEAEAARLEALRIEQEKAAAIERERLAAEKAENDRIQVERDEENRKQREELETLRAAEAARQKEADEKAAAKRAEDQAVIDAEKERLAGIAAELEAARVAEEQRKAAEEAAKVKPLASGYSIVLKNAGKNRWVGLWLDEKNVEQYRTGKAWETPAEALAMVEKFISGEGRA